MTLSRFEPSRFERVLPWSGAVAGIAWVVHFTVGKTSIKDVPDGADVQVIRDNLVGNYVSQGGLVVMGISLLFFAAAIRGHLRSGEAREATYSDIAFGGWIVVVAGIAQMLAAGWALIFGAAGTGDQAAAHVLGYLDFVGWMGLGIGLAVGFIATGLGGLAGATLPRWFAVASIILGVLGALGNAGIPPGGMVNYLLLPVWLIAASVVLARATRPSRPPREASSPQAS